MDKIIVSENPVKSLGYMLARPSDDGSGHVGNIYRKADADLFAEAPAMAEALRKAYDWLIAAEADEPEDFDNPELRRDIEQIGDILARIDDITPTDGLAPPIAGIADKVAHGLWQAKAAKEIEARKAPKKFAPILEGVKWAARSVACSTFTDSTDRNAFMAKCGYQGEF